MCLSIKIYFNNLGYTLQLCKREGINNNHEKDDLQCIVETYVEK